MRCLLLVMCTHPFVKKALMLHLVRSEGRERYFGCNGASAIKCCYAAAGSGTDAEETGLRALLSRKTSIRNHKGKRRRQEDVSKGEPSNGQTGLHSRSSDLTSELQSSVRSEEVVIATEQLQGAHRASPSSERGKAFVSKGMPSFAGWSDLTARMNDVFNVEESSELLSASSNRHAASVQRSPFDLDDTIVPASFEDLAVETRWPEEATDDLLVEFESIRDDQGKTLEIHPPRKVVKQSVSVPVASPSRYRRWPEPRPDLDRNEDPTRRLLVARERANLVGLKLFGSEAGDPCVVESTTHLGCLLEPAGDGVPGNPFDPGNRGNADTLDSESDDPIESSSSMLETVVGRAFRRGERLSALAAPVSTAFPGPGSVESVANDVSGN